MKKKIRKILKYHLLITSQRFKRDEHYFLTFQAVYELIGISYSKIGIF
jgi:hypothetical protein